MSSGSGGPGGGRDGATVGQRKRGAVASAYLLVLAFFLVRFDFWAMGEGSFALGLPWGLTFHVLYCLAAVGVLGLLVKVAWPSELEAGLDREGAPREEERA